MYNVYINLINGNRFVVVSAFCAVLISYLLEWNLWAPAILIWRLICVINLISFVLPIPLSLCSDQRSHFCKWLPAGADAIREQCTHFSVDSLRLFLLAEMMIFHSRRHRKLVYVSNQSSATQMLCSCSIEWMFCFRFFRCVEFRSRTQHSVLVVFFPCVSWTCPWTMKLASMRSVRGASVFVHGV